jgi:molecular chaperone DnaJ
MNPYQVLGVREGASDTEIRAAYKDLVKKYHPDKYQNNPLSGLAEEKLQEVNEAYDMLMKGNGNGSHNQGGGYSGGNSQEFNEVRLNIDNGNLRAAEDLLNRSNNHSAEWMFLKGMVSYRKGWYDDAVGKIQQAVAMEPNNMEYNQALNQMMNVGRGYQNTAYGRGYNSNEDLACKLCAGYACADCLCDCF